MWLKMQKINITSKSTSETMNLGKTLAKYLQKGDIIVLTGELGSGKTKFTEGFLSYYNLQDEISSPTFNIVNEYENETAKIYHFDVYRLEVSNEFYEIGGEEYFEKGICLIEWGELIEEALPNELITIKFEKNNESENYRNIEITANGTRYENILKKIK